MGASGNMLLDTVVPGMGAVISILMYLSPLKAVLKAQREKHLGDLNPIPFSITIANCIAWLGYGLLKKDPFVCAPNAPGVLIGTYMSLTAHGLADEGAKERIRFVVCLAAAIFPFLGVYTSFFAPSAVVQQGVWGMAGNIVCLVYYAAPLSTMWDVIRTRNSSSILVPLTMMNTLNASLWTTYGVAVADPYIWAPNGIGLALSVMQIALRLVFPARAASALPSHAHHSGGSGASKYARLDEEVPLGGAGH